MCEHVCMVTDTEKKDYGTNMRISAETWRRLSLLKTRPGESFEDVIRRLLDERESAGSETRKGIRDE